MPSTDRTVEWPGWKTVRLIGHGSYGAVYEIERDMLGEKEKAALKVISIPQSNSDIDELYGEGYDDASITSTFQSYLKSIISEYSLMRKLNGSSNVVNCDDVRYVQHSDGFGWDIFIKMELLTPLTKTLGKETPESLVIRIGADICKALALCKRHNIIHRDIKPANIFVSDNGDFKLGDFGIAKTVEKTSGGTKIGTYEYMAPEVYHDCPYGSTADIYSLGVVLYWLLNERRTPFLKPPPALPTSSEKEQARKRRFSGEAIPAPAHGSEELKRIVLKACAFDPKDRYQSAEDMLQELEELGGVPETPAVLPAGTVLKKPEAVTVKAGNTSSPEKAAANTDHPVEYEEETTGVSEDIPKETIPDHCREVPEAPAASAAAEPGTLTANTVAAATSPEKKKKRMLPIILGAAAVIGVIAAALLFSRPQYGGWSDWSTFAPASASGREIEISLEYRSREKILLSTEDRNGVVGELDHESREIGAWSEWSDWQEEQPESGDGIEIEESLQYRSREKKFTSSTKSFMDGWKQYDSKTEPTWGSWSEWSTTEYSASDARKVENKLQYQFRDMEYTSSTESSLDGWEQYDVGESSEWGDWSSWGTDAIDASDTVEVESKTQYKTYYKDVDAVTGDQVSYQESEWQDSDPGLESGQEQSEDIISYWGTATRTVYRYRVYTTIYTYYYSRWGEWSSWSDTEPASGDEREIQSRTVYRYKDLTEVKTYYYWQWGSWSDWTQEEATSTDKTEIETRTAYRSRIGSLVTVYYYYDWSAWSDWSLEKAEASDTREVETREIYRYRDRK